MPRANSSREFGLAASDVGLRARHLFQSAFGEAPTVVARASGRVNLIGDHIDYAGGTVLPMALSAHTVAAAGALGMEGVDAAADQFTSEWSGAMKADSDAWKRYPRGVLDALREAGYQIPLLKIALASDVPVGAGLSSSAALEVSVARAALLSIGLAVDPRTIALICQRAEHVSAGVPCGIMDQWVVAHAQAGEALHLDCAALQSSFVSLPDTMRIEVIDSGVRHALSDGGYAERRADVETATRKLGVGYLAHLPRVRWPEIAELAPRIARRARHVVTEAARVHDAMRALASNDIEHFGALLFESHQSLRDDFEVSVPELDALVTRARSDGALGARMTGGGFGGSIVVAWRS